jgi:hypothetical protein
MAMHKVIVKQKVTLQVVYVRLYISWNLHLPLIDSNRCGSLAKKDIVKFRNNYEDYIILFNGEVMSCNFK